MRESNPELEIEVQATRGAERIAGVLDGRFDVAILSHDRLQIEMAQLADSTNSASLVIEELAEHPFCVIAANQTSEAKQLSEILSSHEVPVEMLSRFRLIGLDRSSGQRRQLERAFANRPERLHFGVNAAGWSAVKEYAKHGLGVGIVPLAVLSPEDRETLLIRKLQSDVSAKYRMIHREGTNSRHIMPMQSALVTSAVKHQKASHQLWSHIL